MPIDRQEDVQELRKALLATLRLFSWQEELISSALDRLDKYPPAKGRRSRGEAGKGAKERKGKKKG